SGSRPRWRMPPASRSRSRWSSTHPCWAASWPPWATPHRRHRPYPCRAVEEPSLRHGTIRQETEETMAELTISAADIAAAIKTNREGADSSLEARTVGRVAEVGDGIARVSGLPDAAVNELLEFEDGSVGLALNLDEDSIGAVVLGDTSNIEEGQTVKATGRILSVPVGDGMLGRVVNAL